MAKEKISNYIEHGSPEHLQFLGLRKATDKDKIQFDGYTLEDETAFGPTARPDYLEGVIRQKLSEWKTKPPAPQSTNPRGKNYLPPIFNPNPGEKSDIANVTAYQP